MAALPEGTRIAVIDANGTFIDMIDVGGTDVTRPMGRSSLWGELEPILLRASR